MMTLFLSLALATAGAAGSDTSGKPTSEAPAKPAKPKKICERIESTGSSVPKKVCRTVAPKVESKSTNAVATIPTNTATN